MAKDAGDDKMFIAGVEVTEDEPDDNFRPTAARVTIDPKKEAKEATAAETSKASADIPEVVATKMEEVVEEETPKELTGHWQQLEGTSIRHRIGKDNAAESQFLAWGAHGHVAFFPEERRIEVQLPGDGAPRRLQDFTGLEMAALSSEACCLAAGAQAEGGSRLIIRPHDRWDKAVFTAALGGDGEAVEAVACGDGFVAALTSKRLLRVYANSALPLGVISVPGNSVALAARGPLLLVVTQDGATLEGEDIALEYRLLDVRSRSQRSAGHLPLSPGARLRWVGLSTELAPIAIDTAGQVRVLLGTGAGSWGPAGGGAEWAPMLSLAEEESKVGPLWAVHAEKGVLYCAELGFDATAPQPRMTSSSETAEVSQGDDGVPAYGYGFQLREFRWHLPLGAVAGVGGLAEEALREQLVAHHAGVTAIAGLLPPGEVTSAALAQSKGWKSKAFILYGEFVKAGELERALDVARSFLAAGEGGSRLLTFAQDFAEKAGHFKLADEIQKVPRVQVTDSAPPVAATPTPAPQATTASAGASQTAPKVVHRELPPLFEPGEGVDEAPKAQEEVVGKPGAQVEKAEEASVDLSVPKFDFAALQTTPGSEQATEGSNSSPQVSRKTNPFARKTPGSNAPTVAVRDAGVRRLAPPATPLGSQASLEPALKLAKTLSSQS